MPEQLTKHPDVTLQVLKSAGAQCGQGAAQAILTRCPADRFCKLPGGEICVYGLGEARSMTQISAGDWQALLPAPPPRVDAVWIAGAGVIAGAVIALLAQRLLRRRP